MSLASKVVLSCASLISFAVIGYVHFRQKLDREKLHEGVIKDLQRQQKRKTENIYLLQQQNELTKRLKEPETT